MGNIMQSNFGSLWELLFIKQLTNCCIAWLHNNQLQSPLEIHLLRPRYSYLSFRKYLAVSSSILHGRLYKIRRLFGIFPFIWYVMNQNKDARAS